MSFDFLANISERIVRQWKRYELNKKFVEMARELLVSKEKNLQYAKKVAALENEVRILKSEHKKPEFKPKKKITPRGTSEADSNSSKETPKSKKKD